MPLLLRLNANPRAWRADLECADLGVLGAVMLPKVETPAQVNALADALDELERAQGLARQIAIAALIESPLGVLRARDRLPLAAPVRAGLWRRGLRRGHVRRREPDSLRWAAQQVTNSARAFQLGCWGLADSIANLQDMPRFDAAVREARKLGFTGSVAIHPRQVPYVNRGFSPTDAELDWARRVVAAASAARREGKGVVLVDGNMVDQPLLERAMRWFSPGVEGYRPLQDLSPIPP
ncbi:aldolase/citrate lyase family protein [Achromobacter sp. DMS1]|uniref:aldolase/citrate lyase family protein n=1 Tax=Achromobacter sp. DMS1 TaxID=1688405 RepID=UPI00069D4937|nr:aldolase/citrate lyase family protein [Achromobacter sp. DMS1]